jgi:spore coat protein U-like protein
MTRVAALAAFLLVLAPAVARATVTSCAVTASNVNFGTFSGSQLAVRGIIQLTCSGTGKNNVQVNLSTGSSGAYSTRTMRNGSSMLSYNLFSDSKGKNIWGDGTGGSNTVMVKFDFGKPPPNPTVSVTVFGILPAQALPPFSTYVDTITVNVGPGLATTTFNVTVGTPVNCTISASNLNFGGYIGNQLDGTTTLRATCTAGEGYEIGLSAGTSVGATTTTRAMTGPGGATLAYGLFQDSDRTINWGDILDTDTVSAIGTGTSQSFTVFGRIPAGPNLAPGLYQDTITVTLSF